MLLTQYQRACLICAPELIYSFRLRMYIVGLKVKRFIDKVIL